MTAFVQFFWLAGCGAAVATQPSPSGEMIAFGGGAGGSGDACFTCHGLKGEGDGEAPKLSGVTAGYLVKQMQDYASGRRVNEAMAGVSRRLPDDQKQVVAIYYASRLSVRKVIAQPGGFSALYAVGDASRGLKPCASCHGDQGEGDGLGLPPIAGQPAAYVERQLKAFRDSKRRNDPRDVMGAAARVLSDAEISALGLHVADLGR